MNDCTNTKHQMKRVAKMLSQPSFDQPQYNAQISMMVEQPMDEEPIRVEPIGSIVEESKQDKPLLTLESLQKDVVDLQSKQQRMDEELNEMRGGFAEFKEIYNKEMGSLKKDQADLEDKVRELEENEDNRQKEMEDLQKKIDLIDSLEEEMTKKGLSEEDKKLVRDVLNLQEWYDAMIWQFFDVHTVDNYEDKLRHFTDDFFVIHFILLSIVIALSVAYIADLFISGIVISSWTDLYEILVVLMAGNVTGYLFVDKISVWCFKYYPTEKVEKKDNDGYQKIPDEAGDE